MISAATLRFTRKGDAKQAVAFFRLRGHAARASALFAANAFAQKSDLAPIHPKRNPSPLPRPLRRAAQAAYAHGGLLLRKHGSRHQRFFASHRCYLIQFG